MLITSAMLFSFTGCEIGKATQDSSTPSSTNSQANVATVNNNASNVNDINDAFVELNINPIVVNPINTVEIDVEDIVLNPVNVKSINNIEVEVIPINDEFVTVAHENFVSYYGEDIDLKNFFIDAAVGVGVVLVMVTVSLGSGGTATFFGAVLASEFTKATVVIGAAIDAAISGYQAYQEGGDASYIIGHMINGVAEGFKWSALLAPVTGGFSGLKAIKAVNKLKKLPGFKDITNKQAQAIFKKLPQVIKGTAKLADDASEKTIKNLFKKLSGNLGEDFTEDIFFNVVRNQDEILYITRKFNPFGISSDVTKELCEEFWSKTNIPEKEYKEILKQIQNGTVKNIDDIADESIKKYIKENFKEFVQLYGKSFSKDFIDNVFKHHLGEDGLELLKKTIKDKDAYRQLIKQISKDTIDNFLDDESNLLLIQCRFGADDMSKLVNLKVLSTSLNNKGFYGDSLINKIITLTKQNDTDAIRALGLSDSEINVIGNEIAEYYRFSNPEIYKYFNKSLAEARGDAVTDFIIDNNITIRNVRYAGGIMEPTGANAELIKKQYGNVYMSSQGFAIFDDYAIARVELPNLIGDEKEDIARANEVYWGKRTYKDSSYTWHHLEDGKTLILIPSDLHDAYRHTGGAKLIREGLNTLV